MRFTIEPGGDLEVAAGSVLGACRESFALLTGSVDLRHGMLTVDGHPLDDDHVAGAPPWVAGSTLRVGPGEPDPRTLAVTAPWHLAVVAGPDAGTVAVPGRDGVIRVGRRAADADGRAHLTLSDPSVSRMHLQVRMRRGHRRRTRWVVEDLGSANGTELAGGGRRGHRRRPVRRRARTLRTSEVITCGGTTLLPRLSPVVHRLEGGAAPADEARGGRRPESGGPARHGAAGGSWVAGAVASLALAATTRNPVFLVLVLAGPLGMALPHLVRRMRDRIRGRHPGTQATSHPGRRRSVPWPLGPDAAWSGVHLAAQLGRGPRDQDPGPAPAWWDLAREGLAVVGARPDVLGVVRAAVGAALLQDGLEVTLLAARHTDAHASDPHPPDAPRPDPTWHWLRWLGSGRSPGSSTVALEPTDALRALSVTRPRSLVLVDGVTRWRRVLHVWWMTGRQADDALLVLDQDRAAVPPWCRWVLVVAPDGSATLSGDGEHRAVTAPAAPSGWLEAHARLVTSLRSRPHGQGGTGGATDVLGGPDIRLPDRVALADLGLARGTTAIRETWSRTASRARPGLTATLGVGTDGAVVTVDLLAEGPHMLVAGTTGAGKSELLQSTVLSLALRHPPTELAVVLVDYKGGASFGRCRELPHVVGEVTDLDQVEAARALDGVRAELHRRERIFAEAGVGDLEALRSLPADHPLAGRRPPPRLVVVVDEFRALTEDLPDFVPGLVRVASQGRSLGIHLVLATQRPSGAVNGQLRANMALRLCLRVTDAADSSDVVEVGDAAALPVDRPGRALLRQGAGRPQMIQTAWAALPPGGWTPPPAPDGTSVRWAQPWPALPRGHGAPGAPGAPGADGAPRRAGDLPGATTGTDHTDELVRQMCDAATADRIERPTAIWLPPLPTTVPRSVLSAHSSTDPGRGLPLALLDVPARQSRGVLRWDGRSGALVVGGRPGSGRTGALTALAHGALAAGWHVHVVVGAPPTGPFGRPGDQDTPAARPPAPWEPAAASRHLGLGTVVGADDPRRIARLLASLLDITHPTRTLLVVDDVGLVGRALERLPRGAATDLLERVLREARPRGIAVALAGEPADLVRLLPHAGDRLVLAVADAHDDVLMGVPHALAGGRDVPGRAVHLGTGGPLRCQLVSPDPLAPTGPPGLADPTAPIPPDGTSLLRMLRRPPGAPPMRLAPVPSEVRRTELPAGDGLLLPIGRGGDDAGPVVLDASSGALVVGPASSGRSTALATIVLALRSAGRTPVVVARTGPLAAIGNLDAGRHVSGPAWPAAVEALCSHPSDHDHLSAPRPAVVVVDDLDILGGTDPGLDDLLRRWATATEAGDPTAPRVIGATRTDRAATAYRGAVAALRSSAPVIVLSPAAPGSTEVAGTDLSLSVDTAHPNRAGAGVLVHRGGSTCLQVAGPV